MLSNKRKFGAVNLERRVRPRKFDDSDVEYQSDASDDGSDGPEEEGVAQISSEEEVGDEDEEEDASEGDDGPGKPSIDLAQVSFGDLLKAHKALNKESSKEKTEEAPKDRPFAKDSKSGKDVSKPKRSSKHAPMEMSSKRPVRRGNALMLDDTSSKPKRGDPRFDPLVGRFNESEFRKNYAFLEEYRDKEIKALKDTIKKTKDPVKKEELKRQVKSMEGKRDAQKRKDEERQLLEEHKRKEKELVKQGKQPFYLKKSEQKKQLLKQRFEGMSKGQAEKAIVRKRKKMASKDRRELAQLERVADVRSRR
ncbi:hypothetical protein jhhlp_008743 [Lomentospora prolificans]|uniref:rRNA biogenesis protein RRP36 n=1 Tax=Lomentospora prolificans TaxID=41688 RepID=A0A2N3MYW8_9PEZI|nr:hypothetical protein jhhlp_008743 [Lomentospora prolificans]